MKKTKILISSLFLITITAFLSIFLFVTIAQSKSTQSFKVFATSDIHSYFSQTKSIEENNEISEHGDASKLATILNQRRGCDSIYVDAGDFSMGTLIQAGYPNHAYELRLLGMLGCDVATFGNHEFDFGPEGLASMLNSAKTSGDTVPNIVQSNVIFNSENELKKAFDDYGVQRYIVKEINGVKVGIFGLEGIDSLDCAPTNGQEWQDRIEAAKNTVKELQDKVDFIMCLSHSGTNADATEGEDVELLKQVPQINLCISGHMHVKYDAKKIGDSYIVAPGCYMSNISELQMEKNDQGKWELANFENIPISGNIVQDKNILNKIKTFHTEIRAEYLNQYADDEDMDDVICYSPFTFRNKSEVGKTLDEWSQQALIADSYKYAAKECGINDVDLTINAIGTVRTTILEGPITVSDAFDACSLGVGGDGSSGHPLCLVYVSGKDLKTFVELETSFGPLKEAMKLAYNGLEIKWNNNRMLLDKVTDIKLKRDDGSLQDVEDDKTYKVVTNVYSLNMLNSLNSLSKGLIKIDAKDADGNVVDDFYKFSIKKQNGQELKEWVAFKDYLKYLKTIPSEYSEAMGRKVNTNEGGLAIFVNPGPSTIIISAIVLVLLVIIVLIVRVIIKKVKNPKKTKK